MKRMIFIVKLVQKKQPICIFIHGLILIILISSCNVKKQVIWSNSNPLKWNHFRGFITENGHDTKNSCVIKTFIDDSSRWVIGAFFLKNESWCLPMHGTRDLLIHEQYYFNIFEIYARKIRQATIEEGLTFNSKEFKEVFDKFENKCYEAVRAYNRATWYGRVKYKQRFWQKDINNQLELLNEFKSPFIPL
jgi:hypothetical protein